MMLKKYLPEHAIDMLGRTIEPLDPSLLYTIAQAYSNSTVALSAVNDYGQVFGCAGITASTPGVGFCWAIFDADLIKSVPPSWIYREAKKGIIGAMQNGFHRLQADCQINNPVFENFILNLGFKREGIMRKYGPDKVDHILFSIVEGD
jgi:hypothetical protein